MYSLVRAPAQRLPPNRSRGQGTSHFDLQRPDGSLTDPFDAFLLSPPVGAARAAGRSDADLEAIRAGGHPAYQSSHEEACERLVRSMLDGDIDEPTWSGLALQLRVFPFDEAT
jgi:hypothetical protein